ncbi:MAG TPA: bifunctional 4-hydroxy-2-oxoglutarate aldolase/2-dehydro-3-deoxy-phosphogluconate aldolase [Bryobacteraceae bacterium]
MKKNEVRFRIEEIGIIPAVRLSSAEDALFAVEAVASGGIPIVEVTITVPGALEVIENLAHNRPEVIAGAGTVLDIEAARRCLGAGAKFLTSTGLDLEMVDFAVKQEVVVFPGVLTPTEVIMASKAGADFVKIFPCSQLGGPAYIKALKAPFPQVPLIASGGVNQRTAADFIVAGAVAVGIGGDLIQPDAIKCRERDWIRELAHRFVHIVRDARGAK